MKIQGHRGQTFVFLTWYFVSVVDRIQTRRHMTNGQGRRGQLSYVLTYVYETKLVGI